MDLILNLPLDVEERLDERARRAGLSPEDAGRRLIEAVREPALSPAELFGWILIIFLVLRSEKPILPEVEEALRSAMQPGIDHILRDGTPEEWEALLPKMPEEKPKTGAEVVAVLERQGVFGAWADRKDIGDSADYARQLRHRAEESSILLLS